MHVREATPDLGGKLTWRSTWALIGALIVLVGALALCLDRFHNGDFYLSLMSGRFVAQHGVATHDPFATISQGGTWLNQQWLSELAFFRVSQAIGPTGLTVLYAVLITAPLALLLWICRRKGWGMLVAVAAFYFPGVLAVIHPRAAGFTVLIFSLLVTLLVVLWRERGGAGPGRRGAWWAPLAILALFALWANLHGGFIAGLLLLGLATVGLAIDNWRGIPGAVPLWRVAVLGVLVVLAAVTVTVATPLGSAIWEYLLSFQNQAISLASTEWESAFSSPLAVVYLSLAACFAGWMWVRSPQPRRATTLLVTAGFLVFAGYSVRNVVFIGPVLALQVAWTAPNRGPTPIRGPVALFGAAAAAATLVWAVILGPARDDPTLGFPVADYAIAHPPKHGRIVTYAGVGSYINWRSPDTPVVLNGWLEQYTPQELRDNYRVLRAGSAADLEGALHRIHAGAVIVHLPSSVQRLEAAGFRPVFTSSEGTYLVRTPHRAKLSGP
ncbi:MAG TPA: hypothetical protein VHU24_00830 [Solirubrobacterales bacterium]|nr:hypothetical protein [Solirubrobacterales bacterium]